MAVLEAYGKPAISVRPRGRVGDSPCMAGFLSDAERTRLNRFPADVPRQDMIVYFALSPSDRRHM